jgi:hypothetical protein
MGNPATAATSSHRSADVQHRLVRLDRVVEQLRALRAWEREAKAIATRRLDSAIPLAESSRETRTITPSSLAG